MKFLSRHRGMQSFIPIFENFTLIILYDSIDRPSVKLLYSSKFVAIRIKKFCIKIAKMKL